MDLLIKLINLLSFHFMLFVLWCKKRAPGPPSVNKSIYKWVFWSVLALRTSNLTESVAVYLLVSGLYNLFLCISTLLAHRNISDPPWWLQWWILDLLLGWKCSHMMIVFFLYTLVRVWHPLSSPLPPPCKTTQWNDVMLRGAIASHTPAYTYLHHLL